GELNVALAGGRGNGADALAHARRRPRGCKRHDGQQCGDDEPRSRPHSPARAREPHQLARAPHQYIRVSEREAEYSVSSGNDFVRRRPLGPNRNVVPVEASRRPPPAWSAAAPAVITTFSMRNGRQRAPMLQSMPMLSRMFGWKRSRSRTSVWWKRRKLTLRNILSLGVTSMSVPTLSRKSPGLTKFDWASSLLGRRLGTRLLRPLSSSPVLVRGRPWRTQ